MLYGVCPGRIRALDIRMPSSLKAGSDLTARIEAKTEEGAPGKRVFYLQLIDPSGKASYGMDRCLVAEAGKADFSFRMAFNDPEGVWTLKTTDVLTGLAAERKFTLKK